jgi:chromosome segregation ATPase
VLYTPVFGITIFNERTAMQKLALLVATMFILSMPVMAQVKIKQVAPDKPILRTRAVPGPQADSFFAADVAAMFDRLEQNVEVLFAKLKKDVKDEIPKVNDMSKQRQNNVTPLHRQMNKLQTELAKIDQLQAKFAAMMDSIKRTPGGGLLNGDRPRMQNRMDSLSTQRISVQDQINDLNGKIAMQIAVNNDEKKTVQKQVSVLEQELAELEKQRVMYVSEVRQQKQKILVQLPKEKQANPQQYQSIITAIVNSYADALQENLQRAASSPVIR